MSIALKRFPDSYLELYIYIGVVRVDEMLQHIRQLDAGASWLSYFDPTSDLTGIDITDLPVLKRAITAKEDERKGDLPRRHALVNVRRTNEPFVRFWASYAPAGVPHAHERDMFPDVEGACRWLGLRRATCQDVASAIADAEAEVAGTARRARAVLEAAPGSPGPARGPRP